MSNKHGQCRTEAEREDAVLEMAHDLHAIAVSISRIEARLDAETTAGQAARHTAEQLLVADRDAWQRRAEVAERERDKAHAERDFWKRMAESFEPEHGKHWYERFRELKREPAAACPITPDAAPATRPTAIDESWIPVKQRVPELGVVVEGRWWDQWGDSFDTAWMGHPLVSGGWWHRENGVEVFPPTYWRPLNQKKDDAAPAATAGDGRDRTDKAVTPPVAGTGETTFIGELCVLINQHTMANASNTPDFILAQYLDGCLRAWNQATQQRETWYGRDARPTSPQNQSHTSPRPDAPPVAGTGETTTSEKPAPAVEVPPLHTPSWYRTNGVEKPAPVVKLPRNPYSSEVGAYHNVFRVAERLYRNALDAANVKWEEE